jgi:hypothetical protein
MKEPLFCEREIFEDRPMGMARNDDLNPLVIVGRPLMESLVYLIGPAGVGGGPG